MASRVPLVFVSYASADTEIAVRLAEALRGAGFSTWLYQQNGLPGGSYLQQIHAAVSGSHAMAVLVSMAALHSHQVEKEIVLGHDLGKPFVPILLGLSHGDLQKQKPDYRTAFGAAVSVPLTDANFVEVVHQIIEGLHHMVACASSVVPGAPASVAAANASSTVPDLSLEWGSLSDRQCNFHPEVARIRGVLRRHWPQSEDGAVRNENIVGNRVRVADDVLSDLLDVVHQEWAKVPVGCALVARGGYGRGVLSVGSDIDLTLLHDAEAAKEAETFWGHYTTALTDVWSAVPGIRTAPIIMEEGDVVRSWDTALRGGDLAPLVSFAFSRHIAGSVCSHERLRLEWQHYLSHMSVDMGRFLIGAIRARVEDKAIIPQPKRFDIKRDAGGILEYRLTGFLEQVIDLRSGNVEQPGFCTPRAHHFLLELREYVCKLTGSHLLTSHHIPKVAASMVPEAATSEKVDCLVDELTRHRRRIRTGLLQALEASEPIFLHSA